MSDRIVLTDMRFRGRHGVYDVERLAPQPVEVDVELSLDLRPAGETDDLSLTIDYGAVYETARAIVEDRTFSLIEAIAEAISRELLADHVVDEVVVRVRKPGVTLGGPLAHAAVEVRRRRTTG